MNEDERWFIESLSDRNKSDADIDSSIDVLEVLLSLEALPALSNFIADISRPVSLRERAARAISAIGAEHVAEQLAALAKSESTDVRRCAKIALSNRG